METCKCKADTTPTILESLVPDPSKPLEIHVVQVPKYVGQLAQTGTVFQTPSLLRFSTVLLCVTFIVILHSWTSFFPSLLRNVQDNMGVENTDANCLDPSSVAPRVCDVGQVP